MATAPEHADIRASLKTRLHQWFQIHSDPKWDLWRGGGSKSRVGTRKHIDAALKKSPSQIEKKSAALCASATSALKNRTAHRLHLTMLEHTVTFALKHSPDSTEEADFLAAARELFAIPGVLNFQIRRQTSPKNPHTFGISMDFATPADFQAYRDHPDHVAFVEERWLKEVADFQEADFEPLP